MAVVKQYRCDPRLGQQLSQSLGSRPGYDLFHPHSLARIVGILREQRAYRSIVFERRPDLDAKRIVVLKQVPEVLPEFVAESGNIERFIRCDLIRQCTCTCQRS